MIHNKSRRRPAVLKVVTAALLVAGMLVVPALPASAAAPLVAIDPGHGGRFSGAVNYNYGFAGKPFLAEADANLDIALRANGVLADQGFRTVLTRTSDTEALTPMRDIATWNPDPDGVRRFYADGRVDVRDDLQARVNIANCGTQDPSCPPAHPNEAQAFVSIHNNACGCGGAASGTETYHYPGSSQGALLASLIHEEVGKRIQRRDRGVKAAEFYQLRFTRMPAALLEGVFMDNDEEARLLLDPGFRQQIAEGVGAGIARFFAVIHVTVAAKGRVTVPVGAIPGFGGVEVGAEVASDSPIVAERAMYFTVSPNGGTGAAGSPQPSGSWYFAEGATHSGISTFLLIENPSGGTADVIVRFLTPGGQLTPVAFPVGSGRRRTLALNPVVPGHDVGTWVTGTQPIVVERAMYTLGASADGHVSPGATSPSQNWYFAEGYTGPGFSTFLLFANPGSDSAHVSVELLPESGGPVTTSLDIPPGSRRTLLANDLISGANIGAAVTADRPVVAERSMYQTSPMDSATNVVGAPALDTTWHFAEGFTGSGFTTFLLLANPGNLVAEVQVNLYSAGDLPTPVVVPVLPGSRSTVVENTFLPGREVSATLTSLNGVPFVAERAMYFSGPVTGAHAGLGVQGAGNTWYFAEGYTGPGFSTFLLLYNPGSSPATVSIRLIRS